MRTYEDHEKAEADITNYNTTHAQMFHKAIVHCGEKFAIMSLVDAIICGVDYEYNGFNKGQMI